MSLLGRIGEFLTPIGRSFFDPTFYRHVRTETLTPVVKLLAFLGTLGIALTMGSVLFAALPFAFSSSLGACQALLNLIIHRYLYQRNRNPLRNN